MGHPSLLGSLRAVSEALGIKYYLHSVWRPQASGKVEWANQTLKRTLAKLCQETSESWAKLLPVALMRIRGSPEASARLSPFQMLHGRPFLSLDLTCVTETHQAGKSITNLGRVQKSLQGYGNKVLPAPEGKRQTIISAGDGAILKTWRKGSLADQLSLKRQGPCLVVLSTAVAVKRSGVSSWVRISRGKPAPTDPNPT